MSCITYVLGFVHDEFSEKVLLIEKNRPKFLKGKLNGIGGKIEDDETPLEAMVRECIEECSLFIPASDWIPVGEIGDGSAYMIYLFAAVDDLRSAKSMTDENLHQIDLSDIAKLEKDKRLAPDVQIILQHIEPYFAK